MANLYFYTTRTPIFDDNGEIIGIVGTSTDITSLKKAQKGFDACCKQAEAANRAKTEFLANMSHDMLSPLAGIYSLLKASIKTQSFQKKSQE